ncbi:MAG: RNA polymerase sigma factor [Crocinitomicaceae bacterium]
MQSRPDDKYILTLFHQGGRNTNEAFRLLVDAYGEMLYRQIRQITRNHELTNDILQNVLVKAFQKLDGFKGDSALYTWLYRIARNETLNYLDKEKRRTGVDLDEPVFEILAGSHSLEQIDGEQIQELLMNAIDALPEKQAVVFQLKYFEELKYSEIAERLGTSEGALKASFFHAKEKIKEFLLNQLNQ